MTRGPMVTVTFLLTRFWPLAAIFGVATVLGWVGWWRLYGLRWP